MLLNVTVWNAVYLNILKEGSLRWHVCLRFVNNGKLEPYLDLNRHYDYAEILCCIHDNVDDNVGGDVFNGCRSLLKSYYYVNIS